MAPCAATDQRAGERIAAGRSTDQGARAGSEQSARDRALSWGPSASGQRKSRFAITATETPIREDTIREDIVDSPSLVKDQFNNDATAGMVPL